MGLLMYTMRVHDLIHKKHEYERELLRITKQYEDAHKYASAVGSGINTDSLLRMPASMLGRSLNYIAFAHNNAMAYATTNGPQLEQWYMQQTQGQQSPEQAKAMHDYIMTQLYMQAREQALQIEQNNAHEIETQLQQRKEEVETDLKIVEEELKTYKQERDKSIQDVIPKFGN